jgi:DNA-binding beta-propeller fold protein YncE
MHHLDLRLRTGRALLVAAACAALSACAGQQKPQADVVWPLPPDMPRVKHVRSFGSNDDLASGTFAALGRAFLPSASEAVVAQPTGLALSPDERTLYVASNSAGRVLTVDLEKWSMRLMSFPDENRPAGPFGVATDAEGRLYVTDHLANVVRVYSPEGKSLLKFGELQLQRPTGIAIDRRRGLVYVTAGAGSESKHHRVEVFTLQGKYVRTIGTRGNDPGQFNFPANLAVSKDGSLFVVDMLNFRVQVFDPEGVLVTSFGRIGDGQPGTFDKAKSVGFDSFGNIYVVDSQQGYVQIFNDKFQPLMAFSGRARARGYMAMPTAIAISSQNTIFVADFGGAAVHQFQLINTSAADSYAPPPNSPGATQTSGSAPAPRDNPSPGSPTPLR